MNHPDTNALAWPHSRGYACPMTKIILGVACVLVAGLLLAAIFVPVEPVNSPEDMARWRQSLSPSAQQDLP